MNYQKIHDDIISRSRNRVYDSSIHQNHHIIPVHEDISSTETTQLTIKEHYIVHLLRWKINGSIGNLTAYCMMSGHKSHADFLLAYSIAGNITKDNELGIFRPDLQHLRSEWAMIGQEALECSGNRSGCVTKEWQDANPDRLLEICSSGGKIGGKKVGSMFWWNNGVINKKSNNCPGEGFIRGQLESEKKKKARENNFKLRNMHKVKK